MVANAIAASPSSSSSSSAPLRRPALVAVLFAAAAVVSAAGRCSGADGAGGRPTRDSGGAAVEHLQVTKVALNLLKTLHLDAPPAVPSAGSLDDIRRMLKIDQGSSSSRVAFADGGGSSAVASRMSALLQRDEGSDPEQESMLYIKGERGPDGKTLVFTLSPKDRPFRVTALRLNIFALPPTAAAASDPPARLNSSAARGAAHHHQQDARPLHALRVDVVHRGGDDADVKMERVHSSAVRAAHSLYRVVLPVPAVGGPLARDGRVELRLLCASCPGAGGRQPHDPSQQQQHDSPVYMVVVGRKPAPRPAAARTRSDCDGGCCLRELTVDFNQLGPRWYWVLKPRRFQANYCWGSCGAGAKRHDSPLTRAANQSATSAVLSTMLQHLGVEDNPSCCVPSSSTPVEVLYVDGDGTVRLDRHGLSTVTGCSCN